MENVRVQEWLLSYFFLSDLWTSFYFVEDKPAFTLGICIQWRILNNIYNLAAQLKIDELINYVLIQVNEIW